MNTDTSETDTSEDRDDWPRELRNCTCGTRSYNPDDHHRGCRLGSQPPTSSTRSGRSWLHPF